MNKRNPNTKAYFRGVVEACAKNLEQYGETWPFPKFDDDVPKVSLHFEKKPNGYAYWSSNSAYVPINDALFNYTRRYAEKRGVPIFVEP